jgi:hypothetical protein
MPQHRSLTASYWQTYTKQPELNFKMSVQILMEELAAF